MRQTIIDTLIVARHGDDHADVVASALEKKGARTFRISLNLIRDLGIEWRPDGMLSFLLGDSYISFAPKATIWWRRPGWPEVEDLLKEEADLIEAECASIFYGTLLTQRARWVDHPDVIRRAENKLYQLFTAHKLGIEIPATTVTNMRNVAATFIGGTRTIAKPASSGPGLAPSAREISPDLLGYIERAPVLLQGLINAHSDLRVITIGNQVFSWERERLPEEPIDWRAADPTGSGFHFTTPNSLLKEQALSVSEALGLSMSVQDWLDTEKMPIFLEVNPQGQWLFLQDAEHLVVPALLEHLLHGLV